MSRLNNNHRKLIVRNAYLKSSCSKAFDDLREQKMKLASDIYNDNVSKDCGNKAENLVDELNETPFSVRTPILYKIESLRCSFNGYSDYLLLPEGTYYDLDHKPMYNAEHEFSKRYFELEKRAKDLYKEREELYEQLNAVLRSCSTFKKLREVWPESVNFLDGIDTDVGKVNFPAIKIEDLNKKLNIENEIKEEDKAE